MIFEWPNDIASFCRRRGRGSRYGHPSNTLLVAGISSYLFLTGMIYRNGDESSEDGTEDKETSVRSNQRKRDNELPLSDTQCKQNVDGQRNDVLDVLKLFCLDRGCILRRIRAYLADGELSNDYVIPCGGACPVYSGQFCKYFQTIWIDSSVALFENVCNTFPMKATTNGLFNLLYKNNLWTEAIFDYAIGSINKYHIESFSSRPLLLG